MSRPSNHVDKLMLAAGKKIARRNGCTSLRIREVTDLAGVNLGMFHYHFKSRKRFTRLLLKEVYGEFFEKLIVVTQEPATDPVRQLSAAMNLFGRFLRDNRRIVISLLRDLLNNEAEVLKYMGKSAPPHAKVMHELFVKCQKLKLLKPLPLSMVVPLFLGALTQPILMAEFIEKSKGRASPHAWDLEGMLSDQAIADRVELIISGLKENTS